MSWSEKVMMVPGATVTVAGEKFSAMLAPTPCGITMVAAPPLVLVVMATEDDVGAVEDVVDVVVEGELAVETVIMLLVVEMLEEGEGAVLVDVCEEVDAAVDVTVAVAVAVAVLVAVNVELVAVLDDVLDDDVLDDIVVYTATNCVGEVMETVRILSVEPVSAQCEKAYAP